MKRIKPTDTDAPAQPLPEIAIPLAPYVTRDGQTPVLTEAGVEAIALLAAEGVTQNAIASRIGVSAKTFKTLLGKADADPASPARTAYESGRSHLESELIRLVIAAARKGDMVRQLFALKSLYQYRDQGPSVLIDNGPRISLTLPGSLSEEEYYARLGITGPIDTRSVETRSAYQAALEPPPSIESAAKESQS